MIEQIRDAIYNLQGKGCKDKDLIICLSPVIERLLIEELYKERWWPAEIINNVSTVFGIKINNEWPYNEIVVYDTKRAYLYPELLVKISIKISPFAYPCTECGGDASFTYSEHIKKNKDKLKPGERLCMACGEKRGLTTLASRRYVYKKPKPEPEK
jgi:hypothetical protein